jgi:3-hydroxy acid dehydrogenase / malonic semialdehyde reductase
MVCLITGATSGIGEATARLLADTYSLILCGRRQDRLEALQAELSAKTSVHILNFEVQDRQAVAEALASLPESFKTIDVLINNAGNAHGLAPIHEGNPDDWDLMLDINVKGLLYLTRLISPQMVARKSGHIVNLGSIAGKEVYPNGNVYVASKFAVDALSKAMLIDLNPYSIKVTAIHPGAVETEFSLVRFKGDAERAEKVYAGYQPLTAIDVARTIAFVLSQPPHVNISDLTVLPLAQASAVVWNKKL